MKFDLKQINWGKVAGGVGLALSVAGTLLSGKAQDEARKKVIKEQVDEAVKAALGQDK